MGQIILVLAAFTLLITMTLNVNQAISSRMGDSYHADAVIAATAIAQSMMSEVSRMSFDDSVTTRTIDSESKLTPALSLGKEAGEIYGKFDDIDDFNGFARNDTIKNGHFKSKVEVAYVTAGNVETKSLAPTYYKKITVTVTAPELKGIPVRLERIVTH